VGVDLYYDPVVDEHVGNGPMGLIAPTWYFAPQRREVARAGWEMGAGFSGLLNGREIAGLDNPPNAAMLLQVAGEFADADLKRRLWEAADEHIEPTWDRERGEFTLGFGLNEAHPRGQWNARVMAGWVCTPGAWARIFNEPNFAKFNEPTVSGVDFPAVALSEARWDGESLSVAAHPQNPAAEGTETSVAVSGLPTGSAWIVVGPDGESRALQFDVSGRALVRLQVDNGTNVIRRAES
jgi:hypothetical protein